MPWAWAGASAERRRPGRGGRLTRPGLACDQGRLLTLQVLLPHVTREIKVTVKIRSLALLPLSGGHGVNPGPMASGNSASSPS